MFPPAVGKGLVFLAFPSRDARKQTSGYYTSKHLLLQYFSLKTQLFLFSLPVPISFPSNTCSPPCSPMPPRACPPQTIAPLCQCFVGVCWTTQDRKSRRKMCASSSSSFCVHSYNHRLNHLRLTARQLTA